MVFSESGISGNKTASHKGGRDYWAIKIDQQGNQIWDKAYGGSLNDSPETTLALPDGGFLMGGNSSSQTSGDKSEDRWGSQKFFDYWVIKLDSEGNKIWDNTVGDHHFEDFGGMILTSDGGLLMGGHSNSLSVYEKGENSKGESNDFWVVKLSDKDDDLGIDIFLKNAGTEETIQQINDGETIAIDEIGLNFFNITAESRPLDFGSVHFELQGPLTLEKTENLPPYALFGKNSPDDLRGKSLPPGDYTLKITPYAENKLQGIKGTTREFSFSITGNAPAPINRFVLVDADTEEDVQVLEEGDIINLDILNSRRLSIRAETSTSRVGSVLMELESDQLNQTRTENQVPFALFGGEPKTNYYGKTFAAGDYTIHATPYSESNLGGTAGQTVSLNFTLLESLVKNIILVDPLTGEDIGVLKGGMSLPCGQDFSMRAEVMSGVESVRFELTELKGGETIINQVENLPPYSLLGESLEGDFKTLESPHK